MGELMVNPGAIKKNTQDIGTLSSLTTTEKGSLVGAVNELNASTTLTQLTYNTDFTFTQITGITLTANPIVRRIGCLYYIYINMGMNASTLTIPAHSELQVATISITGKSFSGAFIFPVYFNDNNTCYSVTGRLASNGNIYLTNNTDIAIAGNLRCSIFSTAE
jgi:hypothetical protein